MAAHTASDIQDEMAQDFGEYCNSYSVYSVARAV